MKVYKSMLPYYVGLRDEEGNKMLKEYKEQPEICGQMINLLIGLGQCHITEDWKEVRNRVYFGHVLNILVKRSGG